MTGSIIKLIVLVIVLYQANCVFGATCGAVMGDGYIGLFFPTCTRCSSGTYAIAGDTQCSTCPANSFSVSGSGSCQCNNGYGQAGIGKTLTCTTLCSSVNKVFYSNTCPTGYTYSSSTGSCYQYVSSTKSWSDANAYCNSNGRGYLVTMNSQTENVLVVSSFGTGERWIGFNDILVENTFVWTHGTSTYINWYTNQPDNAGNEDCVEIGRAGLGSFWNDNVCTIAFSFVCEADTITSCVATSCGAVMGDGYVGSTFPTCTRCSSGTYAIAGDTQCSTCPANSFSVSGSGSCQCNNGYGQVGIGKTLTCTTLCSSVNKVFYSNTCPTGYTYSSSTGSCYQYVSSLKNWNDANAYCNNNNNNVRGYLVTMNSQTEYNFVYSSFGTGDKWIGFNDQLVEGTFVWTHGTSTYTNWYTGEPNNAGNEDCVEIGYTNNAWNDYVCSNALPFVCEADTVTTCSSTLSVCSGTPPVKSSLVGYYIPSSWDGTKWKDLSGNNNHVTSITGTVTVQTFSTISGLSALTGTTTTTMKWPNAILPATYTLFHLTKYNGANKQRIISSVSPYNWLSGHHVARTGVAYHNNWITQDTTSYGNSDNWLLSSDQNNLYRAQGVDLTIAGPLNPSYTSPMAINILYANELSDWAVATVLVYNRTLTGDEIQQVERWLYSIYFSSSSIDSATKAYRLYPNCVLSGCPVCPTASPTSQPSRQPTSEPSYPSRMPTSQPSSQPLQLPSSQPSNLPTT